MKQPSSKSLDIIMESNRNSQAFFGFIQQVLLASPLGCLCMWRSRDVMSCCVTLEGRIKSVPEQGSKLTSYLAACQSNLVLFYQ